MCVDLDVVCYIDFNWRNNGLKIMCDMYTMYMCVCESVCVMKNFWFAFHLPWIALISGTTMFKRKGTKTNLPLVFLAPAFSLSLFLSLVASAVACELAPFGNFVSVFHSVLLPLHSYKFIYSHLYSLSQCSHGFLVSRFFFS